MGGYERQSEPAFLPDGTGRLERDPARLQRPPAGRGLGPLRGDHRELEAAGAGDGRDHGHQADQRPRGLHARQRVLPRRDRGRAASSSAPASAPTAWPARAGSARSMAEWIVEGEPSLDLWHMDIRRFGAQYRSPAYTHARIKETYETYYDIRYPNHERAGGAAAAGLARPTPGTASTAPPSARSRAGSGSTGTSRTPPPGDESLRPRGWAGQHWSPAIGAEHRATREAVALFDETSFAKLEIEGPGAAAFLEAALRQPGRPRRRADHLHADAQPAAAGSSATSPSPGSAEERFSIVTGTAFGNHDREWMRRHLPGDGERPGRTTSPRSGPASGSGGRGRARCCSRSPRRTSATRPSPT